MRRRFSHRSWRSCLLRSIPLAAQLARSRSTSSAERTKRMPLLAPGRSKTDASSSDHPILRAENLHRILGEGEAAAHVLKGVSLAIDAKTYVSLVGASGSGKSTLLYLLGALDRPSQRDLQGKPFDPPSRVLIDEADTNQLDEAELATLRNHKIGFVFQFHYLLKEFTAQENVC